MTKYTVPRYFFGIWSLWASLHWPLDGECLANVDVNGFVTCDCNSNVSHWIMIINRSLSSKCLVWNNNWSPISLKWICKCLPVPGSTVLARLHQPKVILPALWSWITCAAHLHHNGS
jgi:hypothetical protein